MASRAAAHGPRGFSLASIMTAFFGAAACAARASMGSVTIRNAVAAEAAAERCRNERRENERRESSEPMVKPPARGINSLPVWSSYRARQARARALARTWGPAHYLRPGRLRCLATQIHLSPARIQVSVKRPTYSQSLPLQEPLVC